MELSEWRWDLIDIIGRARKLIVKCPITSVSTYSSGEPCQSRVGPEHVPSAGQAWELAAHSAEHPNFTVIPWGGGSVKN